MTGRELKLPPSKLRQYYSLTSFVRSGYVYTDYGAVRLTGSNSSYWSGTALSGTTSEAYYLDFNTIRTTPVLSVSRAIGFKIATQIGFIGTLMKYRKE